MANRKLSWRALAALACLAPLVAAACGGADGEAGLSRTEVGEVVRAELAAVPAPPQPAAGITPAEVEQAIAAALAALPQPEAGLSRAEADQAIEVAPAALPQPEAELTRAEVEQAIAAALAALPQPEAGLSRAEVEQAIAAALAALPQPEAGLSRAEVEQVVQAAAEGSGLTAADAERIARSVVSAVPPRSAPAEYTRFVVDGAIGRYETGGLDATLAHYNRPESVDGQWYVFIVDENDEVIGHYDADRRGLDLKGWVGTDANGYEFGPEMLSTTEAGKWVTYVYKNPATGDVGSGDFGDLQLKNAWVVRHDGLLFGSGWYVDADAMAVSLVTAAADTFASVGLAGTVAYFAGGESPTAGLAEAIDYYNNAENVAGEWFAFIADGDGTVVAHYDPANLGKSLDELFGEDTIEATAAGNWVTAESTDPDTGPVESLRVWVLESDGMTFGSGWYDDSGIRSSPSLDQATG